MDKILALDLSTVSTGWSVYENEKLLVSGNISARGDIRKKLEVQYNGLWHLFLCYKPALVVVETPIYVQNHKTAITTGKLHGLLLSIAIEDKIEVIEVDNNTWKSRFFPGQKPNKIKKEQIFRYVKLFLYSNVKTQDEADSILLGHYWISKESFKDRLSSTIAKNKRKTSQKRNLLKSNIKSY